MQCGLKADTLVDFIATPGYVHRGVNYWSELTSGQLTDGKFKLNGYTIAIQPGRVCVVQFRVNCHSTRKELVYFSRSGGS